MRIDDEHDTVEGATGEPQTMAELLAESEHADELRPLRTGEVVEGTVPRINGDVVLVDLGGRSAGVLSLREADEELHVGETIVAFVERAEAPEGCADPSRSRSSRRSARSIVRRIRTNPRTS